MHEKCLAIMCPSCSSVYLIMFAFSSLSHHVFRIGTLGPGFHSFNLMSKYTPSVGLEMLVILSFQCSPVRFLPSPFCFLSIVF